MSYIYSTMHLDKTSHNLKYKYGSNFTPTEITYHQTANKAPAINERNYLNNRTDKIYIGFHIVVDHERAIECIPLNVQTWHSGDGSTGAGNMKSIGVEIAYSTSDDLNLRNKCIENGAQVIAKLMKDYNIPMSKVKSHNDRSGKDCPHDIRGRYGEDKFRALIQEEYNKLTQPVQQPSTPTTSDQVFYQVIVGSYLGRANANAIKAKLESQGYSGVWINVIQKDDNTYYQVICGSYAVRKNAEDIKAKLDKFYTGVWINIKK